MLFCIEGEYTPAAMVALREKPSNRGEAVAKLCKAAGGKMVAVYGILGNGPGAMAIIDVDPSVGPSIASIIASSGQVQNVRVRRLFTMEEVTGFRQKAKELAGAYKAPGQ